MVCVGHETLNYVSLQKAAWNFFPPPVSHTPSCCPVELCAVSGTQAEDKIMSAELKVRAASPKVLNHLCATL